MVEPTETETKESLDAFADAIEEILDEAESDPEIAKQAPYTTPVRRLDEVRATRKPTSRRWRASRTTAGCGCQSSGSSCCSSRHRGEEVAVRLDPLQDLVRLEDQ